MTIRCTACNLRTPDWTPIDARQLLLKIKGDHESVWSITPWARHDRDRSFLVHSTDGGIFALFFGPCA